MYPVMIRLGNITISSFNVMVALAMIVGFFIFLREANRIGLKNKKVIFDLFLISVIGGLIGARIQHIIFDGFFDIYLQKPIAMLYIWKGGLAFYGGVILSFFSAIIYLSIKKEPVIKYLDAMSYSAALGISIGRIGCFLNGCCFGKISNSVLSVVFPSYSDAAREQFNNNIINSISDTPFPVIPTQIYSVIFNFIIFIFLYFFVRKKYKKNGTPLGLWLFLYAIFRFTIEFFRNDSRGLFFDNFLSTSQIISVFSMIIGIILIFYPDNKKEITH